MKIIKLILNFALTSSLNYVQGMNPSTYFTTFTLASKSKQDDNNNNKQEELNQQLFEECKSSQSLKTIKGLIDRKAHINYTNVDGWTCLHMACNSNVPLEIIQFLIKNKADLNIKDNDGWIPLHWACNKNTSLEFKKIITKPIQLIILKFIIAYDIQKYIDEKNQYGETARDFAQENNYKNIILLFDCLQKALDQRTIKIILFFDDFDKAAKMSEEALIKFLNIQKNNRLLS